MKRLCIAVVLGIGLLLVYGCSSTPPGALTVNDVLDRQTELLGQHMVVVGRADTNTNMTDLNLFKIYQEYKNIWVECPNRDSMPPQAEKIKVEGTLQKKKFTGMMEEQLCIVATDVSLQ
jgi:predicted  nucleic acid-binding Zn ribbon protein